MEETTTVKQLLPEVMASMEMLTVGSDAPKADSPLSGTKRVFRKRMPRTAAQEILNRRCSRRPQKRKSSDMESEDDITEYYLNRNSKRLPDTLETILEEKEDRTENNWTSTGLQSDVKKLRMTPFPNKFESISTGKKMRDKLDRFGAMVRRHRRRITMQALLDKLSDIKPDEPESVEN